MVESCPLCNTALPFPKGRHHAQAFLQVLQEHFEDACSAVRVPRG